MTATRTAQIQAALAWAAPSLFFGISPRHRLIAEVGPYIGNSAVAMEFGSGLSGQAVQLITCDLHPCTQTFLAGLTMLQGSGALVVQGSSTQMFQALVAQKTKLDMLHIDGRLMPDDLKLLAQLLKDDTLIALDDCEGDEKGHTNLDLLRRAGLLNQHVYVEPFPQKLLWAWNLETSSGTGPLSPIKLITYTR